MTLIADVLGRQHEPADVATSEDARVCDRGFRLVSARMDVQLHFQPLSVAPPQRHMFASTKVQLARSQPSAVGRTLCWSGTQRPRKHDALIIPEAANKQSRVGFGIGNCCLANVVQQQMQPLCIQVRSSLQTLEYYKLLNGMGLRTDREGLGRG